MSKIYIISMKDQKFRLQWKRPAKIFSLQCYNENNAYRN